MSSQGLFEKQQHNEDELAKSLKKMTNANRKKKKQTCLPAISMCDSDMNVGPKTNNYTVIGDASMPSRNCLSPVVAQKRKQYEGVCGPEQTIATRNFKESALTSAVLSPQSSRNIS